MNNIYPSAKTLFLTGSLDWLTDPIVAVLVGTSFYTYSPAHATLLDVSIAARIAATGTFAGRTVVGGVVDADDISFGTVTGNSGNALILATDTGTDSNSHLIAYLDSGTGFPINPDSGVISITWSNGNNKIFAI